MRLKKIKPGMVVHCKNNEEMKALLEEAERLGYRWGSTANLPTSMAICLGSTIHFYEKNEFTDFKHITWSDKTEGVTEFSDLILPELTAEEALKITSEICENTSHCVDCPIHGNCYRDFDSDKGKIVEVLCKWKSEHEKKGPEIETVDICRIIEIQPDGRKRCVHEEDMENIPIEEGKVRPSDRNIQKRCREILKQYCMEHDGEFIAVHEVVSRVKAVE